MSNIDKIRQEIERLRCESGPEHFDFYDLLDYFKEFIDSLQEEKPSGDLEKAAEEYAYRGIPDEMKPYVKPVGDEVIKNFIAGAKWQANQLLKGSPLPEDTILFQKGVEEGRRLEKDDLALTWEDMAKIDAIILVVHNKFAVDDIKEIDAQKFYEEVLTRFKETKK